MRLSEKILLEVGSREFQNGEELLHHTPFIRDNTVPNDERYPFSSGSHWSLYARKGFFTGKVTINLWKGEDRVEITEYDKKVLWEAWILAKEITAQRRKEAKEDQEINSRLAAFA